jgi:hypothetical protein
MIIVVALVIGLSLDTVFVAWVDPYTREIGLAAAMFSQLRTYTLIDALLLTPLIVACYFLCRTRFRILALFLLPIAGVFVACQHMQWMFRGADFGMPCFPWSSGGAILGLFPALALWHYSRRSSLVSAPNI